MDSVKAFDIEIDLSSCSRIYNIRGSSFIQRPESGWDRLGLAVALEDDDKPDETTAKMMERMYRSSFEKGFLEDDKTKESKGGDIHWGSSLFDSQRSDAEVTLPPHILPVFQPNDVVKGEVKLNVLKEIDAESVILEFRGHARTNLRIYSHQSYYDDKGEILYANEEIAVWKKEGRLETDDDRNALPSKNLQKGKVLSPGKYTFPFEFKIPEDARQSVPPLFERCGDYAYISYFIKATIKRGKMFKRGNIVAHSGLWVQKVFDLAADPQNMVAVSEEKEQETGLFNNGKITARAKLPHRGYVRGSQNYVPLSIEVDNQSGDEIDKVICFVIMNVSYRSKIGSWHGSRSKKVNGRKVQEGAIAEGACPQLKLNVPLDFIESGLDGNLIPAGTLNFCDIIDVNYEVYVKLKRSGLKRNVEISLPIYIGTENSS